MRAIKQVPFSLVVAFSWWVPNRKYLLRPFDHQSFLRCLGELQQLLGAGSSAKSQLLTHGSVFVLAVRGIYMSYSPYFP